MPLGWQHRFTMTIEDQPTLRLLHGFAQSRACWGPVEGLLATGRVIEALDLPGHGAGGPAADGWTTADRLGSAPATDWLGYSLGGRMLLHLLLAHPEVVRRAVLIGATGGIEDPAERRARAAADEVLAQRIEHEGVDAFVERWLAMPLWAGLPEWAKFSQERRTNTATGLAGSLRLAGTGAQDNLWPRLVEIDTPVLVLAGEHDEKFTSIGKRLAAELPQGQFRSVPGAGHATHLEGPNRTATLVTSWLNS